MAAKGDQKGMFKAKLLFAVFIVVMSVSALASATASAAPAEWMLAGKTLTEEGLTTAALKPVAEKDANAVLSGAGLTITCIGPLEGKKPEIVKSTKIRAESLIFTSCTDVPSACVVPTTIGTVPVEGEATLNGTNGVEGVAKPKSGTVFTTLNIKGENCAIVGLSKPVTGDVLVLAPTGQEERTDQLIEVNQTSSPLLLIGSSSASLKGAALLLLENSAAWSFL